LATPFGADKTAVAQPGGVGADERLGLTDRQYQLAKPNPKNSELETGCKTAPIGHVAGFGLPPGLVLRLLLLLQVGGGLAAPVLVVDLDHLFAGRLIAALRLRCWLRSRTFAFAAGHSQTVHRPAA
jgi:hypothetical protein